jgi:pimeloyl-ACP methyl ester carboxylesterase
MSDEMPHDAVSGIGHGRFSRRGMVRTASTVSRVGTAPAANASPTSPLALPRATVAIAPFHLHVPENALRDLHQRLSFARWPDRETVADWSQGVPLDRVRDLVEHWRARYDWRRLEHRLNSLAQYRTEIDGLGIHLLHVRSRHTNALPVILTHGWPGSVVEFLKAIGPLTNPTAYGGQAQDAFHVVIPSLPGFGFSDKPARNGWGPPRIAAAWDALMNRLGYNRYIAQGGDWGGAVTTQLGKLRPAGLLGVHVNFPEFTFDPPLTGGEPTPEEEFALDQIQAFSDWGSGYHKEQSTRPQTVSYGLADSPVGQAAWIYEKFGEWMDSDYHPEKTLTRDEMLDNIMLYWLTNSAASSARIYWEHNVAKTPLTELDLPVGVSIFPREVIRVPKIWAERAYHDLVYFNDQIPAGGHFAAFEQPEMFTEELRKFARKIRQLGR